MAFPDSVVDQAWKRSGGYCECDRWGHGHTGQCKQALKKESRGQETVYGWEAHHIAADGPDTLSNCEILCQPCHKSTQTYGG